MNDGKRSILSRLCTWATLALLLAAPGGALAAQGISQARTQDLKQELYALVIGVSHYRAGWSPLPGVAKDTAAVKKALERAGFATTVLEDPDRKGIEGAFAALKEKLKGKTRGSRLLVYYAGHGENVGGNGYLVPVDAPSSKYDAKGFLAKSVSLDWLRRELLDLPVQHALVLLDNCFSGAIFKGMRGTPLFPPSIRQMIAFPSREIISAGSEDQLVPDESIFRRYFEAALAGAADLDHDGFLTGSELAIFLRSAVANESHGKQTPLFVKVEERGFHKGEFVMLSPLKGGEARQVVAEDLHEPKQQTRGGGPAVRPGAVFRDCQQAFCPSLVALPAGEFMFGAPEQEAGRSPLDLKPTRQGVDSFAMSQYEVTFDQWDACFRDGGCSRWPDDQGWGRGGRPVTNVSWRDAGQFAEWLSRKTGQSYRLPVEVEWEYAARGGMTTARSWGEEIGANNANCRDCGSPWRGKNTAPVGSFPPNGFKLFDMLGNAWEWTGDCWGGKGSTAGAGQLCGIRGGSYSTSAKGVRLGARSGYPPGSAAKNIGFRVVREIK